MREIMRQLPGTSLAWLAFIRIGLGLAMLSQGISKLGVGGASWLTTNPPPLKGILENAVKGPTIDPLYRGFLEGIVLPNVNLFAVLVTFGELLVGLSLILGALTRLGAAGGMFLHLNFMLMKGLPSQGGWMDRFYLLIELIVFLTAAGYALGLDRRLREGAPAFLRALMSRAPDRDPAPVQGGGPRGWLSTFPRASLGWLAIARIGLGLVMLSQGINKLGVGGANWLTTSPTPLQGILDGAVKGSSIDPVYRAFLEGVALPNVGLFATLVTFGEILVGLSLVLGLFTRLGAYGGAFLWINYMLMKGWLAGGAHTDRVCLLVAIVVGVTAAGYVWGLDGSLRRSVPAALRALMSRAPSEPGATGEPIGERRVQPA
jgi:thiosulfate dehydrogenase (quinone) large subunit